MNKWSFSYAIFSLLTIAFLISGCSDQNASLTDPHPIGWIETHAATEQTDEGLSTCRSCHGLDFNGGSVGVSCFECHASGPPFTTHPAEWTNIVLDHQTFPQTLSWTLCATSVCHGDDLAGGTGNFPGPACFNASGCHVGGNVKPHGDSFTDPANHGSLAKGLLAGEQRDPESGLFWCVNCHGRPSNIFDGGFIADQAILNNSDGACELCHENAHAHADEWQGTNDQSPLYISTHRDIPLAEISIACALCHNTTLTGPGPMAGAPSCFETSFTNSNQITSGCHANGPGEAPHPLDGSYLLSTNHGPDAKDDLTLCQGCHAETGGPGSNPSFTFGIMSAGGTGCVAAECHGQGGSSEAHPAEWMGPLSANSHYAAGNVEGSCTLCHGANFGGVTDGGIGLDCMTCHLSIVPTTLDCTYCHGQPPTAAEGMVDHSNVPLASHGGCLVCHGVTEGTPPGTFSAAANYSLLDKVNDTPGEHWDGNIQMNSDTGYNIDTFGCDTAAVCHLSDSHTLADSGLPVVLGAYGGGGVSAPHPLDGTYLLASNHGPDAREDLTFCQGCHGESGGAGSNPRFNIGISSQGGNGCEGCHAAGTAHPVGGDGISANSWYDVGRTHSEAGNMTNACALCHGATLSGCLECHNASPVTYPSGCVSCHNLPPNGSGPAGNVYPNRNRDHTRSEHSTWLGNDCSVCHANGGYGALEHFDLSAPSDVQPPAGESIQFNGGNPTVCLGNCHAGSESKYHENYTW